MTLAEYLRVYKVKQVEAAKELGLSTSFINRLCRGGRASTPVVKRIVDWSAGEISWESFAGEGSNDRILH